MSDYLQKLFGFDGRVAVVIGGTGVLGGEFCTGLAQAGATVVVAGRSAERGQERVAKITALGGKASFVEVDASNREFSRKAARGHGRPTWPRRSARKLCRRQLADALFRDQRRRVRQNHQNKLVCHAPRLPSVRQTHDRGRRRRDSQHWQRDELSAAVARIRLLRLEGRCVESHAECRSRIRAHGVRVNCLCPGFFPAEQNRKILDQKRVDDILRHTPTGRLGEAPELIGAALLLLSPGRRQLHHWRSHLRRRRLYGDDNLRKKGGVPKAEGGR